ncbi:unnamed protein product [Penicillium nalgiovense]|nr:unnamed protein product [Penicillium nalgiovense]CAG8256637.1 unnamed protein product [Penicillium nalgiovense]
MRGLKYINSAGVVHRDLKPSNILINEDCDLEICDFGLARIKEACMTGYVSTRYYRAPEITLTWKRYSGKVDIWSRDCIFAEMILARPLFPGKDRIDQFRVITQLVGSPPEDMIANVTKSKRSRSQRSSQGPVGRIDLETRCSAEEALEEQYLAPYHEPSDEPVAKEEFDWDFLGADLPSDVWKTVIYLEALDYHESVVNSDGILS